MLQLQLFNLYEPTLDCPTYKKVYSVYAYDRVKYMDIWKKIRELAIKLNDISIFKRVSPYRVLLNCYIYDENGNKKSNGDRKHIYRLGALQRIYEKIFFLTNSTKSNHLKLIKHYDEMQAEIADTIDYSIRDKIHIHIKLLRLLRQGFDINYAMSEVLYGE